MTNPKQNYDVIIVGGGHNGLVCAAYLAKSGKKVLVLEANNQIGGAAATEKLCEGKNVSSCAHYLNQLNAQIIKDLNLYKHGLKLAATNVPTIALDKEGNHLKIDGNTVSGSDISTKDSLAYTKFNDLICDYAKVLNFLNSRGPFNIFKPSWSDKIAAIKLAWKLRFGLGASKMPELLRQAGMNIYDVLNDELDNPLLKGALSFDAVLGTHTGPRSPGSVFTYLYRMSSDNYGSIDIPEGGMGSVTQAIAKSAEAAGVEIRVNTRVSSINVNNCAVDGVTLESGETINAINIASNADPRTTVLKLVGARHFEADFVKRIDFVRMRGNAAKLHLALSDLPNFIGLETNDLKSRLVIAPNQNEVERAFNHVKYKEYSSRPMMEITIPSIADNTLTDKGHVLSSIVQYAPHNLKGGWTDESKNEFLQICINRIAEYAPDINNLIEHAELLTPIDLEDRFGMQGGNWHHGELSLDNMLMLRPAPEAAQYALPLTGMFLCGAGAHPGGGVAGLAGKNAAQAILNETVGEKK